MEERQISTQTVPNEEKQEMYYFTMYYVLFMYDWGDVLFCNAAILFVPDEENMEARILFLLKQMDIKAYISEEKNNGCFLRVTQI